MTDYSNDKSLKESPNNNHHSTDTNELEELRSLLFGIEPPQLKKLYQRLDNPDINAEDISRLLPEAVILRTMQADQQLSEAIVPTIEEAIQSSVKKDLTILSEAIFPVIGPASRKAVSTALDEMLQSLNQTLEHSLSPQSLKWRIEARQTGKSFAEVVMLRTLLYRVEQVFLIHKETGLVLQHLLAGLVSAQDPSLVSAMLTAIQDFVKDSFNVENNEVLDTLQFGELTIWIEEGPQAVLAGVIRGNPPQELRLVFQEVLEKIHLKLSKELNSFQGETEPFEASKIYLESCLQARYQAKKENNYTYAFALVGVVAIAVGIGSFFTIREKLRWGAYLDTLNSQPGIVVINTEKRQGKYFISGMRDPLAIDPRLLMKQANIESETVIAQWEPYLSFEPEFALKRAQKLLQPPKTVSLKIDENGILSASGSAPQQWIVEAQKLARFLPGITQYQDKNLLETELAQLESYKKQIEQQMLLFSEGTTEFLPGQDDKLQALVTKIKNLLNLAKSLNKDVRIQIVGHANTDGTAQRNMILSQERASETLTYLASQGINQTNLRAVGVGTNQDLRAGAPNQRQQNDRRVSFQVFLTNTPN